MLDTSVKSQRTSERKVGSKWICRSWIQRDGHSLSSQGVWCVFTLLSGVRVSQDTEWAPIAAIEMGTEANPKQPTKGCCEFCMACWNLGRGSPPAHFRQPASPQSKTNYSVRYCKSCPEVVIRCRDVWGCAERLFCSS